jgi:hypothetical protein
MSIEFFIFPPEWRQRTIIMLTHVGGSQYFCSRFVHVWFQNWNKSGTKGERTILLEQKWNKIVAKMRDNYATQLSKWLK